MILWVGEDELVSGDLKLKVNDLLSIDFVQT